MKSKRFSSPTIKLVKASTGMENGEFFQITGTHSGSILIPSTVAQKIRETCIVKGEPLVIKPPSVKIWLSAVHSCGVFTFHLGDRFEESRENDDDENDEDEWNGDRYAGSAAQAYHYLSRLPLCPEPLDASQQKLGKLVFIDSEHPGSNGLFVQTNTLASIACLQYRLNQLRKKALIEIEYN